ncbi:hypothetical protein CYMTET_46842 [Cymbomonas tetramitiformis]|uniref:Uncharacterized protein n=1 Tax=Cymbomonas tetramitiformis TaxID=36881 RepID=A0AAE0BVF7_9CHLO|nr:hypothetical protein CYMTET_46842 [Cymbomonas tetramitiformis]
MDVESMAANYLERAEYVKRAAVMAGSNIAVSQHRHTERYAQLDGKRMLKVTDGRSYEGTVQWMGASERPYALKCNYDDGDSETFTLAARRRHCTAKTGSGTSPDTRHANTTYSPGRDHCDHSQRPEDTPYDILPDTWDLRDRNCTQRALATLMPGPWDAAHVTKLAQHVQRHDDDLNSLPHHARAVPPA